MIKTKQPTKQNKSPLELGGEVRMAMEDAAYMFSDDEEDVGM